MPNDPSTTELSELQRQYWSRDQSERRPPSHPVVRALYEPRAEYLASLVTDAAGASVLDVGCGNGFMTIPLEQCFGRVVGADYSVSKAGLLALTKKLALEVAPYGITVNAVAPGTTRTTMIDEMKEENRKILQSKIPVGRFGTPEDIAHAVCFLAGEEASFITGATLDVNGGLLMR